MADSPDSPNSADPLTAEESAALVEAIFELLEHGKHSAAEALGKLAQDPAQVRAVLNAQPSPPQSESRQPWEGWVLESGFSGIITDKRGHRRQYQDGKEVPLQDHSQNQNSPNDQKATPPTPEEVAQGLEAKIDQVEPGLSKQPGLLGKARKAVYAAYEHVNYLLVKYQSQVDAIGSVLGAVLDTPKDMEKLGYNPSISSGGHASSVLDPLQVHAGISTHFACTLANHAVNFGFKAVKKLLKGEGDAVDLAAELLHGVFEAINRELGLEGVPEASAIAAKLRSLLNAQPSQSESRQPPIVVNIAAPAPQPAPAVHVTLARESEKVPGKVKWTRDGESWISEPISPPPPIE